MLLTYEFLGSYELCVSKIAIEIDSYEKCACFHAIVFWQYMFGFCIVIFDPYL